MKSIRLPLLLPLAALAIFGFGCKSTPTTPVTEPVPNAVAPVAPTSVAVTPPANAGVSRDVLYARQVLRNLSQANAFRANMLVPTASGLVSTSLDYNRLSGISGTIKVPDANGGTQTADLYASD
ncbi:MAG TPA: hypothetical protein VMU11_02295, partial [Verrucomicrobiae bacterium]|nr:hypothetical protein [Verrucomicrobiae bacterium]